MIFLSIAHALSPDVLDERMPEARNQLELCARDGCDDAAAAEAAWLVAMHTYLDVGVADGTLSATVRALDPELFAGLPPVVQQAATEPFRWVGEPTAVPTASPRNAAPPESIGANRESSAEGRSRGGEVDLGGTGATVDDTSGARHLQLSIRGGGSKYFAFDFVTVGLELGVPVSPRLMVVAGVERFHVERELPSGQTVWNRIHPLNVGAVYRFGDGEMVTPYAGVDAIFAQYYKDTEGADWAGGARLRGGVDLMLGRNFGLNANAAVGAWAGENWTFIDPSVGTAGLLSQLNGGVVLAL